MVESCTSRRRRVRSQWNESKIDLFVRIRSERDEIRKQERRIQGLRRIVQVLDETEGASVLGKRAAGRTAYGKISRARGTNWTQRSIAEPI